MSDNVKRTMQWSMGLVLVALGFTSGVGGQQAPPGAQTPAAAATTPPAQPAPLTPLQIAHNAERQRIMNELKISGLPAGAVNNSPATYDETTANPYPIVPTR